jgi:two-component system nitrate/nitrite response regulator NarL
MLKRVLIADDNMYVRDVIRTFLHDASDIQICGEAVDGRQTLEMAHQLTPDVVLLDLSMPTINGADVAIQLRQSMPDIRIILFTMYSEQLGKAFLSSTGADAVLSKPDGLAHLVDSINAVLAAPHAAHLH